MSIVLQSSGGGSITVQEPATASNFTQTLPAATGTVVISGTTPSLNGIAFPATQSASADANTLDDYEEGTWTPVIVLDSGTSTGGTFNGTYIKIGRQVTLTIFADVGTVASSPAIRGFSGLPFTSLNSSQQAVGSIRENSNTGIMWMWRVDSNATLSLLRRYDNASGLTSSMNFTGTVTYFVP